MYLTEDIISGRGFIYGKKGTKVEIIADHTDIQIVQDPDGNRYAVRNEFLTDQQPASNETIQSTPEPESPSNSKKTKTKKADPPAQPGLFG